YPSKTLSVTFGMQAASQYCGKYTQYENGEIIKLENQKFKFSDLLGMTIPRNDDAYYAGNHLGSWDIRADWKFGADKRHTISAYVQWPWEDGSGIGKQNGWDGLWGLQYSTDNTPWLSSVVIEYLDFTNQSGPMHWDAGDFAGTTLVDHATGADSYYNNYYYNGYALYGLSQGTPFLRSPMYNTDGYLCYTDTRVRGFHIGASGKIPSHTVSWRILFSWRKSLGDAYVPRVYKAYDTSWLAEATWNASKLPGMSIAGRLAMDRGNLYGNTFGAMLTIKWNGSISLPKK
ncbi:MAG: capsule assembly Wzi family protein, partial [Muribaculum sp.]|nr:capsule assembly Wzi family protein [Muribaculum sp.]